MQESTASEIVLNDIQGSSLEALVSHMYGNLPDIEQQILLPLFVAADKYQVKIHH